MGRFAPTTTTTGTVKSIQHVSATMTNDGTVNITISAVSNTNKAYIISAGESSRRGGAAANDQAARTGHGSSTGGARLTNTTNVAVSQPNIDMFPLEYYNTDGTYRGSVIEVT